MTNYFKCVFFDEDNGASIQEVACDELLENREEGEEIPEDDDADVWLHLVRVWDNGDCRCIMSVEDARNAALHVLEATGGLPPIKALMSTAQAALDKLDELLASDTAGINSDTGTDIEELQVALLQSLSLARELGSF